MPTLAQPSGTSLAALRRQARDCTACPLYRAATQTVFGEGPARARLVLVGEQPGDQEDHAGYPFIGPAGLLLDRALAEAGLDRAAAYVTNAVKHFKFVREGRRRLHQKPGSREIAACRPWLEAELALLQPAVVVALGATAAQTLMGPTFRVLRDRGHRFATPAGLALVATVHPSAILRAPPDRHDAEYGAFVSDLKVVARFLKTQS
jgi:uracil-DNA glycosylase family protein